jgi:hypothetical protein
LGNSGVYRARIPSFFAKDFAVTQSINMRAGSYSGPGSDFVPVVPSDAEDFAEEAVSLYIERGGQIRFVTRRGETRTVAVPDFSWVLCFTRAVRATGTTASGIHALMVN